MHHVKAKFILVVVIILAWVVKTPSLAQISFAPSVTYPTGSWPRAVGIGDVNNDGLNDVVLGTTFYFDPLNDYTVFVYLQDNLGNLTAPVKYRYSQYYPGLNSLVVDDVSNDGLKDVIISYGDSIGIFYQNPGGTLNSIQTYYSGNTSAYDISTGDLNNDGLTDIAVNHWGVYAISILYQQITGGFTIQNFPSPSGGYDEIEIGDLNNDNLDDVVLMLGQGSYGIHIYTQTTSGTLNNYFSHNIGWMQEGISIGDLNNDNCNDIAISGMDQNFAVTLLMQDTTNGIIEASDTLPAYTNADKVRIANLNCDRRNEVILVHGGWSMMTVYEQDINNVYNSYLSFPITGATHYLPKGICVGDVNSDGRKDVVVASDFLGLSVIINQSTNNGLIIKPLTPAGEEKICMDILSSTYTTFHPDADQVEWNIFPEQAGSIILSTKDSCLIAWSNNWQGIAGISVDVTNVCGTSRSDTLQIQISRPPLLNLGNDTILCSGKALTFSPTLGFDTYTWLGNVHHYTYNVTSGGTYTIAATHACGTQYDTIMVNEIPLPVVDLVADTILCNGASIQLDVSLPGSHQYRWQDNSTSPLYTVHSPGTYAVEIMDSYRCRNSGSIVVSELSPPVLHWTSDTLICSNNSFTLQAENPSSGYLWHDGSIRSYHLVADSGSYAVTVANACGTVQGSIHVDMEDCTSYLDIPSAFSPNGDGVNDVLYAVGVNVDMVQLVIFNRWGQKVFESNSLEEGWDGTLNGRTIDPGVYVYSVTAASTVDGHGLQKQGNITLIR